MRRAGDKNSFRHLDEAYRSIKKKNYTNAVVILEKVRGSGRDDVYALFLLALSLLYTNSFNMVNSIMSRIERIDPDYLPYVQLRAYLALKSSSAREEAVSAYITALEKNSRDRLLRSGLKRIELAADFTGFQRSAKISDLVSIPKPGGKAVTLPSGFSRTSGRYVKGRGGRSYSFVKIPAAVLFIALLSAGAYLFFERMTKYGKGQSSAKGLSRDGIEKIDMVDIGGSGYGMINRVNREKTPELYTSGSALVSDFNRARTLIKRGEFNSAVTILNRILNSNAGFPVKEKSEFLLRFIIDSDEKVYEEMDLKKIVEKPYLYRGSAVKFTGKAANVKDVRGGKAFSLMAGYDGSNFSGICEVYSKGDAKVNNGDIVEVKGVFIMNAGKGGVPYISADMITPIRN